MTVPPLRPPYIERKEIKTMCCKTECCDATVYIPLGIDHPLSEADVVQFGTWEGSPYTYKECAKRFHAWLQKSVGGGFSDALFKEMQQQRWGLILERSA